MTDQHRVVVRQDGHVPLHLVVSDRLPIGRAGDGLIVDDDRVSRRHCEIEVHDGELSVRDLGSSNGTLVNGSAIAGRRALEPGDVVELGGVVVEVVGTRGPAASVRTEDELDDVGATIVGRIASNAPTERIGATTGDAHAAPPPATAGETASVPAVAAGAAVDSDREADSLRASVVGTTLTLVISDIVDSTTHVHRLGDREWLRQLGRHDELSREQIERFRGTVVKGQGDGFLLTFPSARHALLASAGLQRTLAAERAEDPDFTVHVRIGVHTGEVIHSGGDVFGRHVHRAARVASTAEGDEVVVSSLVRELAETMGDLRFGPPLEVQLKGFEGVHTVHRLQWDVSGA